MLPGCGPGQPHAPHLRLRDGLSLRTSHEGRRSASVSLPGAQNRTQGLGEAPAVPSGFCSAASRAAAALPGPPGALPSTLTSLLGPQPHPWSQPGFHTPEHKEGPLPSTPTNCFLDDAGTHSLTPKWDAS